MTTKHNFQTDMAQYDATDPPNTSLYINADPITTYPDLLEELKTTEWISYDGIRFDEDRIEKFQQKVRNRPWEIACRLDIPKQMIDLAISIKLDQMGYESAESVQLKIPDLEHKLRLAKKTDSAESTIGPMSASRKKPVQFTFTKCEACQQILRDTSDDEPAIRECLPKTQTKVTFKEGLPSTQAACLYMPTTKSPMNTGSLNKPSHPTVHKLQHSASSSKYLHGKPKSSLTKGSRKSRTLCPRGSPGSVILPQVGSPEFDGIWNIPCLEDNTPLTDLETELGNDSDDLPVSVTSDH